MAHTTPLTRQELNKDWTRVAKDLTGLCNLWAGRRDLTVYLGRDGGQSVGAPAFYDPLRAEIEVNSDLAFGADTNGTRVGSLLDRQELSKYPVAGGLALHEAMHARFSLVNLRDMNKRFDRPSAFEVYQHLEEVRIEGRAGVHWPSDSVYLRASCKELIMGDTPEWDPRMAAVLLLGRAAVGVLTVDDVKPVEEFLLKENWTPEVIDRVRAVAVEFVPLDDTASADVDRMVELANELDEIMPKPPARDSEGFESMLAGLLEAIGEALQAAKVGGMIAAIEEGQRIAAHERREGRVQSARVQEQNEKLADSIFRQEDGDPAPVPNELVGARAPLMVERSAAVKLSHALERARYRDYAVENYDSPVPTGRFNGGEAMRVQAARWANAPTDAYKPFRRQRRQATEHPPLTVGIMSDTSGSMNAVQPQVASAIWIISDAVYRVSKASAAQVYFGSQVLPGLRKGERPKLIREWKRGGSYEDFDKGFRALDGELNLINGRGARLLFVISDGHYKTGPGVNQIEACEKWINRARASGVAVVWIQLAGQVVKSDLPGMRVVQVGNGLVESAEVIGAACIEALAQVSGV